MPAQTMFRRQRARRIMAHCPEIAGGVVIDIGGSLTFWQSVAEVLRPARVIIYNISAGRMELGLKNRSGIIETHIYDGHKVPEPDKAADVVICNSVIEHVPPDQRAGLAAEIMRVGKRYVVQTPAFAFPVELHFGLPFIHWLPRRLGRVLVRASPFAMFSGASAVWMFDETRLLRRREFAGYFPGAQLEVEYCLGLPKSLLAFG